MIKPTIGHVVLVHPDKNDSNVSFIPGTPIPALVCDVISDREISVGGVDSVGNHFNHINIPLLQDDDKAPEQGWYAEWMPYQKKVAEEQAGQDAKVPSQFGTQYPSNPDTTKANPPTQTSSTRTLGSPDIGK